MATIDEVRAKFEASRAEISALDQKLAAERTEILDQAFLDQRQMTTEENARLNEIVETRSKLGKALEALALSTIDDLENAEDLASLLRRIETVNELLDDDLGRLQRIVDYTETAAKVAKSIATAAETLTMFHSSKLG